MTLPLTTLLACAEPAEPAEPPEVLLHTVESGHGARARFYGQQISAEVSTAPIPVEYGVERLCFELPDEEGCIPFEPWGALYFSDWRFEGVFSPDGQWALLQQDRFCPYTVVAVAELGRVLRGERPPDFTFGVELAPAPFSTSTLAPVCEDARWEGDDGVVFTVSVHGEEAEARWERPFVPPAALRPD
jgi:hypothetical protein